MVIGGKEGESEWYTSTEVILTIQDGESDINNSKATKMKYIMTGANTDQSVISARVATVYITNDGITTITYSALDEEGNESERHTIEIKKDSVAPTLILAQQDTETKEYSKVVDVTATDDMSTVQIKKYDNKVRNGAYFSTSGEVINDNNVTLKMLDLKKENGEPSYTYSFYAKDNAGNETIQQIEIKNMLYDYVVTGSNGLNATNGASIDPNTGIVTVPINGTQFGPYWTFEPGTYMITYSGDGLPQQISSYQFRSVFDPEGSIDYPLELKIATSNKVVYQVEVTRHTESIELMMYGTNITSNAHINNIRVTQVEKLPNTIDVRLEGNIGQNNWYTSNVKITMNDIAGTARATKMRYKITGANEIKEQIIDKTSETITINTDGISTLSVSLLDDFYNESELKTIEIKKDTQAPNITLTQKDTATKAYTKEISSNISDNASGVVTKKYAVGNQSLAYFASNGIAITDSFVARTSDSTVAIWSPPTLVYTVYAKDEAGHEKISTITVSNLLIDNIITAKLGVCANGDCEVDQSTGRITLKSTGATQYGPYWPVPAGTYEIIYNGSNLPATGYSAYSNGAGVSYQVTVLSATSTQTRLQVVVTQHDNISLEVALHSSSSTGNIIIDNIEIKQLG